jgi:acyl-CoA thioesterase-1
MRWALLLLLLAAPAWAEEPCPPNKIPPIVLPRVKEAVAANREITIVALGSSSTQGWHSSDLAHTYPAILQGLLNAALPTAHVAVINRGVGGQDISEMLPRLEADVIAIRPAVAIFQVGANSAMKHMAPDLFKRLLTQGVRRLEDAKIDVVLMDNQRARTILAAPEHMQFDQAMADVAAATGASLFDRGALMDQWRRSGYPYERFMSDDGIHHNDYGYRCVAQALSAAIIDGVSLSVPTRTASKR